MGFQQVTSAIAQLIWNRAKLRANEVEVRWTFALEADVSLTSECCVVWGVEDIFTTRKKCL